MIKTTRLSALVRGGGGRLVMDEEFKKLVRTLGFMSTVGMSMALAIALGALVGYYLDRWLESDPWFLLVFTGFGIAAAFRNLYILYKKVSKL